MDGGRSPNEEGAPPDVLGATEWNAPQRIAHYGSRGFSSLRIRVPL